ncbi:hypothetical protein HAX54_043717, partial [Datura stramonium]|nr:hypothetical protein [Datura stramonium]
PILLDDNNDLGDFTRPISMLMALIPDVVPTSSSLTREAFHLASSIEASQIKLSPQDTGPPRVAFTRASP